MADEGTTDADSNLNRSDLKSKMNDQEAEKGSLSNEIEIKAELLDDKLIENPIGKEKKNRSNPPAPAQLRSTCRPRSRDPRRCQKHFREIIGKHETKNEELEKKEGDLRQRLEMLECSMPAMMVWNIWRMSQGAPIPNIRQVVEKQLQGFSSGAQSCPSTPSQHYDCRVREVEAERKQAQRRADEARALWAAKELALEEQKKKLEEARKTQALHKQRIEELTVQVQELRKARDEDARDQEEAKDKGSCQTGECGEIRCKQMCLGDVVSTSSVKSTDLECLARLQELAEAELCMKRHITELERREETYMRTLQQADELWSKMEGDTASTMSGLQEQLDLKTAANQQLADKVCSLEDAIEKMNKRLANCRQELGKFVDIERVDAIIGSDDDHAGVADKNTLAGAQMKDKDTMSKKIAMVDTDTMDEKNKTIDKDTITDEVPSAGSEICGEFSYDSDSDGEPCSPDFACNDVVFSPNGMEETKEMINKDTITDAIIGRDAIIGSDYDQAEVVDKDTIAGVKMKDNDTVSKKIAMVDANTMDENNKMIDKDTTTDGMPYADSKIYEEFNYHSDLDAKPCSLDYAFNDVVFTSNDIKETEEEEDITIPKIITKPKLEETKNEQEGEIKIKGEKLPARKVDTGQESDEEYQLAVENFSDDKIPLNEREESEKVQVLEAGTPSVIGKLSSNIVRDGEAYEGVDEKELSEIDVAMQDQVEHKQENLSHVLHQQNFSVKDLAGEETQKDIASEGRESTKDTGQLSKIEDDKKHEVLGKESILQVKQSEKRVTDDEENNVQEDSREGILSGGQKIRGVIEKQKTEEIGVDAQGSRPEMRIEVIEGNETLSEDKQIGVIMEEMKAKEIRDGQQVRTEGRKEINDQGKEMLSEGKQIDVVVKEKNEEEIKDGQQESKSEGREEIIVYGKEISSEGEEIESVIEKEKGNKISDDKQVPKAEGKEETIDVISNQEQGEKIVVPNEKDKPFGEAIISGEKKQAEKDEERGITGEDEEMLPVDELNVAVSFASEDSQISSIEDVRERKTIKKGIGTFSAKNLTKAIAEDEQISPIEEVEEEIEETVEPELDKGIKPTLYQIKKVGTTSPKYLAFVLGRKEIPENPEEKNKDSEKYFTCPCGPERLPQKKVKPVSKDRVEIVDKHICKDKDASREETRSRPKLIIIRKTICSRPDEIKLHLQRDETMSKIKKRKVSYIKVKDESVGTVVSVGLQTQKTVYKEQSTSRRSFVENKIRKYKQVQTVGSYSTINSSSIISDESAQQVQVLKKYKGPIDSESRCFMCKKELSSKNNVCLNDNYQATSSSKTTHPQSELSMVCCSCQEKQHSKSIIQAKNKCRAQEKLKECPRPRSPVFVEQENIGSHISFMKKVSHGKKDQSCLVKIVRSKVEYRERKQKCESEPNVKNRKKLLEKVSEPEADGFGFSQTQSLQTEAIKSLDKPSSNCTCITENTNSLNGNKSIIGEKQFKGEENLSCHCDSD